MSATLYVIPGSHPSMAARLMLEHKGIEYKRRDLMPVIAKPVLKAMRFPAATVPALRIDGQRIQGSTTIARELDRLRPEPPLLPGDAERRAAVEEAERWGDEVAAGLARRITWNGIRRDRSAIGAYGEGAKLGVPLSVATKTAARSSPPRCASTTPTTTTSAPISPLSQARSSGSTTGSPKAFWAAPTQRRRPPDRHQHPPADDARRRPPRDRGTPGGRARADASCPTSPAASRRSSPPTGSSRCALPRRRPARLAGARAPSNRGNRARKRRA